MMQLIHILSLANWSFWQGKSAIHCEFIWSHFTISFAWSLLQGPLEWKRVCEFWGSSENTLTHTHTEREAVLTHSNFGSLCYLHLPGYNWQGHLSQLHLALVLIGAKTKRVSVREKKEKRGRKGDCHRRIGWWKTGSTSIWVLLLLFPLLPFPHPSFAPLLSQASTAKCNPTQLKHTGHTHTSTSTHTHTHEAHIESLFLFWSHLIDPSASDTSIHIHPRNKAHQGEWCIDHTENSFSP